MEVGTSSTRLTCQNAPGKRRFVPSARSVPGGGQVICSERRCTRRDVRAIHHQQPRLRMFVRLDSKPSVWAAAVDAIRARLLRRCRRESLMSSAWVESISTGANWHGWNQPSRRKTLGLASSPVPMTALFRLRNWLPAVDNARREAPTKHDQRCTLTRPTKPLAKASAICHFSVYYFIYFNHERILNGPVTELSQACMARSRCQIRSSALRARQLATGSQPLCRE
jgi:hypothetical protein